MRVLFVDDESKILQGMRRMLFAQGVGWDTAFATTGDEALKWLGAEPFDAIVTDMRMAPMNGTELLKQVRESWPSMLRVVLSGHTEADAAIRALHLAHQLLSKPCDAAVLIETVRSGVAVQSLLAQPVIRSLVSRLTTLPTAPKIYAAITQALRDPNCDGRRIAAILARDPALSAKVLQVANSAYFGSGRAASDPLAAVTRIGLNNVNDLVMATEVFDASVHGNFVEQLRDRALLASRLASKIAADRPDASAAATAALLTDIGYLVPNITFADVDLPLLLSDRAHAEVGAYLLALWGLPLPIVEAVAYHHTPARVPRSDFGMHGIVHVAAALAAGEEPDLEFLAAHDMAGRLPEWQALCAELATSDA
jgi:HD-like signal output (HDOD) protein